MDFLSIETAGRLLAAFALVAMLVPLSLPLSQRLGLHDLPGGRKQHGAPTSYIGGLLILFAIAVAFVLFDRRLDHVVATFFGCGSLLALVGFLDDRYGVSWKIRFLAQGLAALGMIAFAGASATNLGDVFGFASLSIGWLAVPFTIFIVLGVINALNMIDGSDGLAGGQAFVSMVLLSAFALQAGSADLAVRLLTCAAAVAGFLVWNLRFPWQPRARIFLGNAGSMVIGFTIAWAAVRMTQNSANPVSVVLAPWTIAIPLIDCVSLMFRRVQNGNSPFKADRNHLHHLLLEAGYSPIGIAWGLMAVSLVLGVLAGVAVDAGVFKPLVVIVFLALLAAYHVLTANRDRAVRVFASLRWGKPAAAPEFDAEDGVSAND